MYQARVTCIRVKPHRNADRIQLGYTNGIQVIVGLDTQDNELGVFFPCDGQLSVEFCHENNLFIHNELNSDVTVSGFFEDNRRVRARKFRGEISDGFWCPLSYFKYTKFSDWKNNLEFTELNNHQICQKYYTPATHKAMRVLGKSKRTQASYNLPRHYDTKQLVYNLDLIKPDDKIIITEKLHGTSARIGYVQVERENNLKWWQRLYNKLPFPNYPQVTKQYEFVVGTRNTIASEWITPDSNEWYRLQLAEPLKGLLRKGEVIYTELVGFDSHGGAIMNRHDTEKLKDKTIKRDYGKTITYNYNCAVGTNNQNKMYVYRITQVNADGYEIELTWNQIKKRARELGLECVPELDLCTLKIKLYMQLDEPEFCINDVLEIINQYTLNHSLLSRSHIREGVCVRLEKVNGEIVVLKHKSFVFKLLEGIAKENDGYVDTEEIN